METNKEEQRFVSSNIKISINVIIAMIVTVAFLLLQFFVLDDVITKARTLSYWIGKIISGLATFTIMISLANTTEESRKKKTRTSMSSSPSRRPLLRSPLIRRLSVLSSAHLLQFSYSYLYLYLHSAVTRPLIATTATQLLKTITPSVWVLLLVTSPTHRLMQP